MSGHSSFHPWKPIFPGCAKEFHPFKSMPFNLVLVKSSVFIDAYPVLGLLWLMVENHLITSLYMLIMSLTKINCCNLLTLFLIKTKTAVQDISIKESLTFEKKNPTPKKQRLTQKESVLASCWRLMSLPKETKAAGPLTALNIFWSRKTPFLPACLLNQTQNSWLPQILSALLREARKKNSGTDSS